MMTTNREAITVSALNRYVKALLEHDEILTQVWVEGELSDVHIHLQSGHIYFKVIDQNASVRAVMFRSYAEKLGFVPKDGMKVLVSCRITLYEKSGEYQLNAFNIVEIGTGKRQTQLEETKKKLSAEGLFDESRKRRLPINPDRISVITSVTGSVIRDIQNVCTRRNPFVELILYPVYVQGLFAVDAIVDAINSIKTNSRKTDLVIIARGGGSTDDLWVFNDERLVRAACALPVPFISAVGHETDFTLLDFGADLRVPTPSAAAEMAVPDIPALIKDTENTVSFIGRNVYDQIQRKYDDIESGMNSVTLAVSDYINELKKRLSQSEQAVTSLSPLNILSRGYSYITKDKHNVNSVTQLSNGDYIDISFSDGIINCMINEVRQINE